MTTVLPPYLAGNRAPLGVELDLDRLAVEGELPPELDGWLYRIGPDLIGEAQPKGHWFVADGMVHGMEFRRGRAVRYRNRWVRTAGTAAKLGEPDPGGPPHDQRHHDTANTDMISFAGMLLAMTETCMPHRLTPELETVGRVDFGASGGLTGGFATHPKLDPVTGDLYGVTYRWDGAPRMILHHVGPDGRWVSSTPIDVPAVSMVHDMAITEHHALLLDLPVLWERELMDEGWRLPVRWSDDHEARIGVVPLAGGPVRWFPIAPCYVFHVWNAYEVGSRIVLDAVRHERMCQDDLTQPATPYPPAATRWELDLATGAVAETAVAGGLGVEFPQVDLRLVGRRHRHGFAAAFDGAFAKIDFETGARTQHAFGPGTTASEPIFVPAADGTGDDEGWLVGTVHHADTDTSEVVVVDAHDLAAPTRARVRLDHRIPAGFHGAWVPR